MQHSRCAGRYRGRSKLIEEALCVRGRGRDLFALVQRHDLEGIVAKRKGDAYEPRAKWIKIKNPRYSQGEGRGELLKSAQDSAEIACANRGKLSEIA